MSVATCPQCRSDFDPNVTHDGRPRRTGVRRTFCSRSCGNRAEHLRNGRNRALGSHYGITQAQYDQLLARQDGGCRICRRRPEELPAGRSGDGRLYVDHDHSTGVVRALLCGRCNAALGMACESVDVLLRMVAYLKGELR